MTSVGEVVEKKEPSFTAGGIVNWYSTMANSVEIPQKIKSRVTIWPSNPSSGDLSGTFENIYLQRCAHSPIHCSIIHGGHEMETTEVSFDRWFHKDNVVHTPIYNGILPRHKKRWNIGIGDNMDGYWEYHAKQNKSGRKSRTIWSTHIWDIKLKATNEQTKTHRHGWH